MDWSHKQCVGWVWIQAKWSPNPEEGFAWVPSPRHVIESQSGFWWVLRPSHIGLSPKLGGCQVWVSATWDQVSGGFGWFPIPDTCVRVPSRVSVGFLLRPSHMGLSPKQGFCQFQVLATWVQVQSKVLFVLQSEERGSVPNQFTVTSVALSKLKRFDTAQDIINKKMTTHRNRDNICKWCNWERINLQHIQTAQRAQHQNKQPNHKMSIRSR